jgi:hypothetical protein
MHEAVDQLLPATEKKLIGLLPEELLIADARTVRGYDVYDIKSSTKARQEHVLSPMAKVRGRQITYPP